MPEKQSAPVGVGNGWYFVRVWDGPGHVGGLIRYPIAVWAKEGKRFVPYLAKPGRTGVERPSQEDDEALVGFVPPGREWQTYFSGEDVQQAALRLHLLRHPGDAHAAGQAVTTATVQEVTMPGIGKITVRDAKPPSQAGSTAGWIEKAWGGTPRSKLPGS